MEKFYVIDCVEFFTHDTKFDKILVVSVPSVGNLPFSFPAHYKCGKLIGRYICFDERTKDVYLDIIKSINDDYNEAFEIKYFDYNSYGTNFIKGFIPQF